MSTDLENRVYNNYRAALRVQMAPRAAARRQAARKITVKRYNLPYAQVKEIVARLDAENGITHEHTLEYALILECERAQAAYDANPIPCTSCGGNDGVRVRYDPYDVEIHGEWNLCTLCIECYTTCELDI